MAMFIFSEKVTIRAKISLEWVMKPMNLFSYMILNMFIQDYKRNASTNHNLWFFIVYMYWNHQKLSKSIVLPADQIVTTLASKRPSSFFNNKVSITNKRSSDSLRQQSGKTNIIILFIMSSEVNIIVIIIFN